MAYLQTPKMQKNKTKLYNSIKMFVFFYISYKKNTSFTDPSYWGQNKKKFAYLFFKLCDLLLVCTDNNDNNNNNNNNSNNTIWCDKQNSVNVKASTRDMW